MKFICTAIRWMSSLDQPVNDMLSHPDLINMDQRQLGDLVIPPEDEIADDPFPREVATIQTTCATPSTELCLSR